MKPMIGITSSQAEDGKSLYVSEDNIQAVTLAGGIPIVLPNLTDEAQVEQIARTFDGVLFTGGGDIDPTLFGEEPLPGLGLITPDRDTFEVMLTQELLKMNKPILGICRGCQIINIAAGGDMYQDIYGQIDRDLLQHQQKAPRVHRSHYINIQEDSLLYKITGMGRCKVNSYHHQALREMAEDFQVCATATDGVIEAFESTAHDFVVGVQWHPENTFHTEDKPSRRIFEAFIHKCKK